MDTEHFKKVLLRKQDELRNEMAGFRGEARQAPEGVEDPIDEATSAQGKAAAFEENTLASQMLRQVEDALQRITEGTYGACVDCGRESSRPGWRRSPGRFTVWKISRSMRPRLRPLVALHFDCASRTCPGPDVRGAS